MSNLEFDPNMKALTVSRTFSQLKPTTVPDICMLASHPGLLFSVPQSSPGCVGKGRELWGGKIFLTRSLHPQPVLSGRPCASVALWDVVVHQISITFSRVLVRTKSSQGLVHVKKTLYHPAMSLPHPLFKTRSHHVA